MRKTIISGFFNSLFVKKTQSLPNSSEASDETSIESVKTTRDGTFALDIKQLLTADTPVVYCVSQGKYTVQLSQLVCKHSK